MSSDEISRSELQELVRAYSRVEEIRIVHQAQGA